MKHLPCVSFSPAKRILLITAGLIGGILSTPASSPPEGMDKSITLSEDIPRLLLPSDFGFSDPGDSPANQFSGVAITTIPTPGSLSIDGTAVATGQSVSLQQDSRMAWTPRESSRRWTAVASSADGTKLLASGGGVTGYLYTSADEGATWVQRNSLQFWEGVASSSDGTKLFGAAGVLHRSTDSGVTWTTSQPAQDIRRVAASSDGSRLLVGGDGSLYTSTNSGVTWTTRAVSERWVSLASSADGTKLAAAGGTSIYISPNSGSTWTTASITANWTSVACSADGTRLAAVGTNTPIYISANSGATWTAQETSRNWTSIASSADGTRLVALAHLGRIYTSRDAGLTWSARESTRTWSRVASSADGNKLIAAPSSGFLYTSSAEVPQMIYTPAANAFGTPYASFTFQVKDDGTNGTNEDPTPNTITFNVEPVNDAPVLTGGIPDQIATERSAFSYQFPTGLFTDADPGTSLSFSATQTDGSPLPGWVNFNPTTRTFSGTPGNPNIGTWGIRLTANDGAIPALSGSTSFYLSALPMADPPGGTDGSTLLSMGGDFSFGPADFGFTDPDDIPAHRLSRIRLASLPAKGMLRINGVPANAGDFVRIQPSSPGAVWSAVGPAAQPFISVASSADGQRLAAVSYGGFIHISTDSGASWTQRGSFQNWFAVTSSADGQKLVAAVQDGPIFTSTDGGTIWIQRPFTARWRALTSSADGSRLAAIQQSGRIFTSSDSGLTWIARDVIRNWYGIASSADGLRLAAVVQDGLIYLSSDAGISWTPTATVRSWRSISSSGDGTRLAAVAQNGRIYTSQDAGLSWVPREVTRNWYFIASSADGNRLTAVAQGGLIYVSADAGVSWLPRESNRTWRSAASSSNGLRLIAADNGGRLYTSEIKPAQRLSYLSPMGESGAPYTSFTFEVEDEGTAGGHLDPTPNLFTINVGPDSAFEIWAAANGLSTAPGADGGRNLLNFAFGLDASNTPQTQITLDKPDISRRGMPGLAQTGTSFSVIFGRRKNAGLSCIVEFSNDLTSWEPATTYPSVVASDDMIEALEVPFPAQLSNGMTPRFSRVRVTTP
jgi:Putative Ig domain